MTYLGAFTKQMAGDLASLRPLVVAKKFDSAKTAVAARRVAVTLTAFAALEQNLRGCAATAELVQRVELLRSSAEATLKKSQSAALTNAPVQRAAAASLFGLLPEVLALSEAGKAVADTLGTALEVAQIPDGASKPLGKLAPLPTPTPRPTPIPPPKPKTVALPKLSVKIAGANAIKYFSISGDAPIDLDNAMEKNAHRYCGDHALACVELAPNIDWVTSSNPYTGFCTITSVSIPLRSTVFMPRWTKPSRVHPALLSWWRKVLDHIAWHEGQHIKIEKSYLAKMKADLTGEPCSHGQSLINRWSTKAKAAQAAFDAKQLSTYRYPPYAGPGGFYGN